MKTLSLWTLLLPISLLAAGEVQAQELSIIHCRQKWRFR